MATGRASFRGLAYDDLHRLQLDLETTGLDAERERIFLVSLSDPRPGDNARGAARRGRSRLDPRALPHDPRGAIPT